MIRRAGFAGTWYTERKDELAAQLQSWLQQADVCCPEAARAIIAPHAGYSYSGPTAAWAYKHVGRDVKRVFVLGPSHNVYLDNCAVTRCVSYATPLGDIPIDTAVRSELLASKAFGEMELDTDEGEHSIELHLPYIVQVMGGARFTLVPILVGALTEEMEAKFGKLLARHLADPENLFVISSDFCHWGERFKFTHYDRQHGEIFQSIEALDRRGMALIEQQDASGFAAYQRETKNTICGRRPPPPRAPPPLAAPDRRVSTAAGTRSRCCCTRSRIATSGTRCASSSTRSRLPASRPPTRPSRTPPP
jgi:AmmeMemoRadiSam system protein B